MRRRPQPGSKPSITQAIPSLQHKGTVGLVLSGGGSRAAYQVGVLRALQQHLQKDQNAISIIVGSSIGAINGLLLASTIRHGLDSALTQLENMWIERTFRNTFAGSPSRAFLRSVKLAILKYASDPEPNATQEAIFDPSPLMNAIDEVIASGGGLEPDKRAPQLRAVAVMTTVEGKERKPLLFLSSREPLPPEALVGASFSVHRVDTLSAKHGFASAALPSVLPPIELDIEQGRVQLVDGGISQNVPVDPAVRLGAERVIVIDISGRDWWLQRYGNAPDSRPTWEVPAAAETFCLRPPETFVARCKRPLGPLLKDAVGRSNSDFIAALGPTWPIFTLCKAKLGEDVAYEVMSYVALHGDYARALIERGYNETTALLRHRADLEFTKLDNYKDWYKPENEKQVA